MLDVHTFIVHRSRQRMERTWKEEREKKETAIFEMAFSADAGRKVDWVGVGSGGGAEWNFKQAWQPERSDINLL